MTKLIPFGPALFCQFYVLLVKSAIMNFDFSHKTCSIRPDIPKICTRPILEARSPKMKVKNVILFSKWLKNRFQNVIVVYFLPMGKSEKNRGAEVIQISTLEM